MENYKEKYEQALERAKVINPGTADYEVAVKIFPELKKSGDEDKVMKGKLREILRLCYEGRKYSICASDYKKLLVWLEKQDPNRLEKEIELTYKTADEVQYRNGFKAGQNEVLKNLKKYGLKKQDKNIYDKEMSKLLRNVICVFINNPQIQYSEREEVLKKLIPYIKRLEKQGKHKSAWSEKDEKIKHETEIILANTDFSKFALHYTFSDIIYWLKSLKERMIDVI